MDKPQCRVTITHVRHDNTQRDQVINFVSLPILLQELLIETKNLFFPTVDIQVLNTGIAEFLAYGQKNSFNELFFIGEYFILNNFGALVFFGENIGERQHLKESLEFSHAQPVRNRSVDFYT